MTTTPIIPGQGVGRFAIRMDELHWCGLTVDDSSVEATLRIGPAANSVGFWLASRELR